MKFSKFKSSSYVFLNAWKLAGLKSHLIKELEENYRKFLCSFLKRIDTNL